MSAAIVTSIGVTSRCGKREPDTKVDIDDLNDRIGMLGGCCRGRLAHKARSRYATASTNPVTQIAATVGRSPSQGKQSRGHRYLVPCDRLVPSNRFALEV